MKVVIITGGSRGLGRSAALQCASRGIDIILTYNSHPAGAEAAVAEIEQAGGRPLLCGWTSGRARASRPFAIRSWRSWDAYGGAGISTIS